MRMREKTPCPQCGKEGPDHNVWYKRHPQTYFVLCLLGLFYGLPKRDT